MQSIYCSYNITTSQSLLGIVDWPDDYFVTIAREYLAARHGHTGRVGAAEARLFEATPLNALGVRWMEEHFVDTVE